MAVKTERLSIDSKGNTHVIDLTDRVRSALSSSRLKEGIATVFVVGSTAAITTTEFEPGLVNTDLKVAYERIAPEHGHYQHEATWNDDNGHSHVRASLTGPSVCIPFVAGQLILGTWQQVVLIDFDTRPRRREVIVQIMGE